MPTERIAERSRTAEMPSVHRIGSDYRVWAPIARSVVLQVSTDRITMVSNPNGWWTAPRARAEGERYGFIIDDEGPFPDPRSPFQPDGVHGLSECVDHGRFAWTDAAWQPPPLSGGLVYELHVGTFARAGTFDAVVEHLDHLVELGVTHIELMPVAEFPGAHGWGYDGVDLFAPHHHYGRPDDLKRLVDSCHARGLAVILDVVYNHLGPEGNYLSRFGPYFADRYHTPWGAAVNLDGPWSDEVRRFFCDNAAMWLRDYHFDGLRLDAVHAMIDTSATHLLEQLSCEVDRLEASEGRHFVLIAESDLNDPRVITPRESGGHGIDAQWSDDFHHAIHSVLTGEQSGYYEDFGSLQHLAAAFERGFVYAGTYSAHRRRVHGRPPRGIAGWRFVVALQNHDQVGNRAMGERLSALVPDGRLRIAAALLLTSPFVPMLFQGEEWGATTPFLYFTAHENPELGRQVSEGRRREFAAFGWEPASIPDPQERTTLERSILQWDERFEARHQALLTWYRALIALRKRRPTLSNGDLSEVEVRFDQAQGWFMLRRNEVGVAVNLSGRRTTVPMAAGRILLASTGDVRSADGRWELPAESVVIVELTDIATRP